MGQNDELGSDQAAQVLPDRKSGALFGEGGRLLLDVLSRQLVGYYEAERF